MSEVTSSENKDYSLKQFALTIEGLVKSHINKTKQLLSENHELLARENWKPISELSAEHFSLTIDSEEWIAACKGGAEYLDSKHTFLVSYKDCGRDCRGAGAGAIMMLQGKDMIYEKHKLEYFIKLEQPEGEQL